MTDDNDDNDDDNDHDDDDNDEAEDEDDNVTRTAAILIQDPVILSSAQRRIDRSHGNCVN
jgi:hypothetical protein